MCLRNINAALGVMNDTWMIVERFVGDSVTRCRDGGSRSSPDSMEIELDRRSPSVIKGDNSLSASHTESR